ncbi:MAG: toprim domain-containing protein [Candidatus Marinimicrobia bacterium]|nr:toprim domain-containing protein [Candidatus Neomarinimicrobiota bacterium]
MIVVEGFFGVMHLWQCGFKNVVALMGKELSDKQLGLLLSSSDRITLFLDGDPPGRDASKKVTAQLINSTFVRVIKYSEGKMRKPAHFEKKKLVELLRKHTPR